LIFEDFKTDIDSCSSEVDFKTWIQWRQDLEVFSSKSAWKGKQLIFLVANNGHHYYYNNSILGRYTEYKGGCKSGVSFVLALWVLLFQVAG
jgi:hypothetical protein